MVLQDCGCRLLSGAHRQDDGSGAGHSVPAGIHVLFPGPSHLIGLDPANLPHSIRANFYKCGDKTAHPHYLSWSPIDTPKPDFHRPDFFGELLLD